MSVGSTNPMREKLGSQLILEETLIGTTARQ